MLAADKIGVSWCWRIINIGSALSGRLGGAGLRVTTVAVEYGAAADAGKADCSSWSYAASLGMADC